MSQVRDQEWRRLGKTSISDRVSPDSISGGKGVNAGEPASSIGARLFRYRTSLPLPIAAAILTIPSTQTRGNTATILIGLMLTAAGEVVRLWGVRHIGTISRTRSERLGPLVVTGPFSFVRNPLYLGNIALWTGFALTARLPWLVPPIVFLLGLEYHAIVRWEEGLLEARLGASYSTYKARVPRWFPKFQVSGLNCQGRGSFNAEPSDLRLSFTWRETLFSERGTLIAMAAGYLLLWLKARF